jgi:integrase
MKGWQFPNMKLRKCGSACWEFLWRETDAVGKRVRRTALLGTIEQYPTRELAQEAANGLRMRVNEDRTVIQVGISSSKI